MKQHIDPIIALLQNAKAMEDTAIPAMLEIAKKLIDNLLGKKAEPSLQASFGKTAAEHLETRAKKVAASLTLAERIVLCSIHRNVENDPFNIKDVCAAYDIEEWSARSPSLIKTIVESLVIKGVLEKDGKDFSLSLMASKLPFESISNLQKEEDEVENEVEDSEEDEEESEDEEPEEEEDESEEDEEESEDEDEEPQKANAQTPPKQYKMVHPRVNLDWGGQTFARGEIGVIHTLREFKNRDFTKAQFLAKSRKIWKYFGNISSMSGLLTKLIQKGIVLRVSGTRGSKMALTQKGKELAFHPELVAAFERAIKNAFRVEAKPVPKYPKRLKRLISIDGHEIWGTSFAALAFHPLGSKFVSTLTEDEAERWVKLGYKPNSYKSALANLVLDELVCHAPAKKGREYSLTDLGLEIVTHPDAAKYLAAIK